MKYYLPFFSLVLFSSASIASPKLMLCYSSDGESQAEKVVDNLSENLLKIEKKISQAKVNNNTAEVERLKSLIELSKNEAEACDGAKWKYAEEYLFDTNGFTDPNEAEVKVTGYYACGLKKRSTRTGFLKAEPHNLIFKYVEGSLNFSLTLNRETLEATIVSTTRSGTKSTKTSKRICNISDVDISKNKI